MLRPLSIREVEIWYIDVTHYQTLFGDILAIQHSTDFSRYRRPFVRAIGLGAIGRVCCTFRSVGDPKTRAKAVVQAERVDLAKTADQCDISAYLPFSGVGRRVYPITPIHKPLSQHQLFTLVKYSSHSCV